ncbi:hypothetical protein ACFQJ7_14930 [Halovenus rubra]|uniref:Uncharacterized protein n=2 Tax=Halovenus rubra TaxID=869890 RepID=A0ABD5XCL2_9EURY|nr:hypothetical protein [Halovenus rubra]
MRRRRFLGTVSGISVTGVAGCLGQSDDGDSSGGPATQATNNQKSTNQQTTQDDNQTEDGLGPAETVVEYSRTRAELLSTEEQFYHSLSMREPVEVRSVEGEVIERDIDTATIVERTSLEESTLSPELSAAETALVEINIDVVRGSEQEQTTTEWFLATEDGEWRILEQANQFETDTGSEGTEQVAGNIKPTSQVGTIGVNGADSNQIGEIRLVVQPDAGSADINLADLTLQYVSDKDFANIVVGAVDGETATVDATPSAIEIDDTDKQQYNVDVVTAESEDNLLMTDSADRYELVIPLSDEQDSLPPLNEGATVEITITTAGGAQTVVFLEVPDTLSEEAGTNVTL